MSNVNDFIIENGILKKYTGTAANVIIPDGVVGIDCQVFRRCKKMMSVSIPTSVKTIGEDAFAGNYGTLKFVYIQDMKSWCEISFENHGANPCASAVELYLKGEKTTNLVIPDSVNSISDYTFYGCKSLESVIIPNGVKRIGNSAFKNCSNLSKVHIETGVTTVGSYAFNMCENLASVTVPESVIAIGDSAFGYCHSLKTVNINSIEAWCSISFECGDSNPCYWGADVYLDGVRVSEFVIPDSITSIGNHLFHGCASLSNVVIPNSVTSIGTGAFAGCKSLIDIKIPNSVKSIKYDAFAGCSSLTCVAVPDTITSIASYMFAGCASLKSIDIPSSVTSIEHSAFKDCVALTNINIPDSVVIIGHSAFENCTSLLSIAMPNFITEIEIALFEKCSSLVNITIPDGVTEIKSRAFKDCISLVSVQLPDSLKRIWNESFSGCQLLKNIKFPESLCSIGGHAFSRCISLEKIDIPRSVYSMDFSAFYGTNAKYITVEQGNSRFRSSGNCLMTGIGLMAMGENSVIPSDGSVHIIYNSALIGLQDKINLVQFPEGIHDIGEAFSSSEIQKINVPQGVLNLKSGAFFNCKLLTSVIIPASVTEIEKMAFEGCDNISDLEIQGNPQISTLSFEKIKLIHFKAPNLVAKNGFPWWEERFGKENTYIAAFENYDSKSKIVKYAKQYYEDAFKALIAYDRIDLMPTYLSMWKQADVLNVFDNLVAICNQTQKTTVLAFLLEWKNKNISLDDIGKHFEKELARNPFSVTEMKKIWSYEKLEDGTVSITGYKGDSTDICIPDKIGKDIVTSIAEEAFYPRKAGRNTAAKENLKKIEKITIPASVTKIGKHAFSGCIALKSVYINDLTAWCNISFEDSSSNPCCNGSDLYLDGVKITDLVIPNTIMSIGKNVFHGCDSLTNVTIPKGVTIVDDAAFYRCRSLVNVDIPDSVTTIGADAFCFCKSLVKVDLPESIVSIGKNAFSYNRSLVTIHIPDSVTSIGDLAFSDCDHLADITLPKKLVEIGAGVFWGSGLKCIVIPDSLKSISDRMFKNSKALTNITISNSITLIGEEAFYGCESLKNIFIPLNVKRIRDNAFGNCPSTTIICEAESQPKGWNKKWNADNLPITWEKKK